jgi:pimeloyl-ACP methyl ester carboxylesterase
MTDGLVLLHAFPVDATMWDPQIAALRPDLPVIAPNFPGFGGAPLMTPVMHMDAAADTAADEAARAGIERVVLCGLSMGGYVAFAFWRRYRERVIGLVLANTKAEGDDEAGKERRLALAERLRAEGNQFMVDSPPPLLSAEAPKELWDRVKAMVQAQPAEAIAAASLGMAERPDSSGDLQGIEVPTMVVTSTADTLIPPEVTRTIADRVPGSRLEIIDGAGHLSNLEASDRFNALLREHLQACGVGGR